MGATTPIRTTQQKLRLHLDTREWGVRTLARKMAEQAQEPHRVESLRRQLKRYLSATDTVVPSTASRHAMEDALGVERDSLKADAEDDSEAAEPMASLSLDEFLRFRISQIVAEQLGQVAS